METVHEMDDNRGNRGGRQQRGGGRDQGRNAQGDDTAEDFDFDNLVNEGVESLGDNLGEASVPKFMKRTAARLRRAGINNIAGVGLAVVAIKASIKTRSWNPNVKAFLEGLIEGLEDGLKYEMRRLREIERDDGKDALKREIDKILAPPSRDHGTDHSAGHGTGGNQPHGPTGHGHAAAPAAQHSYSDVDELMAKHPQRQLLTTRFKAIRDRQPRIWGLFIQLDGRGAFFSALAEIVLGNPDASMAIDSIERLLVKHGKAHDDERKAKVKHPEDGWFEAVDKGFGTVNRMFDRGLDAAGVPPARQIHHNNDHGGGHGPHTDDEDSLTDGWDFLKQQR